MSPLQILYQSALLFSSVLQLSPGKMNSTYLKAVNDLAKYYPEQDSIWMYAMVAIGCAFILFVVITMSIICKSTIRQWKTEQSNEMRQIPMRRFGSNASFLQFEEEITVSRVNLNYEF